MNKSYIILLVLFFLAIGGYATYSHIESNKNNAPETTSSDKLNKESKSNADKKSSVDD
ncbi:hypothetical protein ACVPPR_04480 [Dellaglioa sp. L3N]